VSQTMSSPIAKKTNSTQHSKIIKLILCVKQINPLKISGL
jgi:hypothetical protein